MDEYCGYPVADASFPIVRPRDLDLGPPMPKLLQLHACAPARKQVDELSDTRMTAQLSQFFFKDARSQLDWGTCVARYGLGHIVEPLGVHRNYFL